MIKELESKYNTIKSLYLHIPFCDHICSYCDFNKIVCKNDLKEKYIDCLIKELNYKSKYYKDLSTIYIGGGTPSCLNFSLLIKLFNCINNLVDLNKIKEFTFECNPKDINEENINKWIDLFNEYHINRISLGIQSFSNSKLKEMNRNHNKKIAIKTLKLLHKYHFDNINCDLIYGFTKDNLLSIKKDINLCIKNHVKHISYYSLILEENTILFHKKEKGLFKEMNEDKEGILYNKITKYLEKKYFKRYEISNFSLLGYESLHNSYTWLNNHYIACGVSGSYYIDNIRYTNIKSIEKYIKYINDNDFDSIIDYKNQLSINDQMDEEILLGLRLNKGLNIDDFNKKYKVNIFEEYKNIITLINQNILVINDRYLHIKFDKIYLENAVLEKIL